MEIDPSYCDVIVRRWEDATGQPVRPKLEPPRAEAEAECIERIAETLGWKPHECEGAA